MTGSVLVTGKGRNQLLDEIEELKSENASLDAHLSRYESTIDSILSILWPGVTEEQREAADFLVKVVTKVGQAAKLEEPQGVERVKRLTAANHAMARMVYGLRRDLEKEQAATVRVMARLPNVRVGDSVRVTCRRGLQTHEYPIAPKVLEGVVTKVERVGEMLWLEVEGEGVWGTHIERPLSEV